MIQWRAGAERRTVPTRSTHEHTGHNNPIALGTTTVQAEMTLLSAVGDDCTTLAALRDANSQTEAAPLKPSVPVIKDGNRMLVRKAGYDWLRRLVTPAGYGDWLW